MIKSKVKEVKKMPVARQLSKIGYPGTNSKTTKEELLVLLEKKDVEIRLLREMNEVLKGLLPFYRNNYYQSYPANTWGGGIVYTDNISSSASNNMITSGSFFSTNSATSAAQINPLASLEKQLSDLTTQQTDCCASVKCDNNGDISTSV